MAKKKIDGGCCTAPKKTPCGHDDLGPKLMPNGFAGNRFVGLRYVPSPGCGPTPGNSVGMTRADYIAWSKENGHRVDPVEALQDRLEDADLYEYALTEPTGE